MEYQEPLEVTGERECREELGIEVKVGKLVSVAINKKYENHYIIFSFIADSYSGQPELKAPDEHSEIKWFKKESLPSELFISTKHALDNYFSGTIYRHEGENYMEAKA